MPRKKQRCTLQCVFVGFLLLVLLYVALMCVFSANDVVFSELLRLTGDQFHASSMPVPEQFGIATQFAVPAASSSSESAAVRNSWSASTTTPSSLPSRSYVGHTKPPAPSPAAVKREQPAPSPASLWEVQGDVAFKMAAKHGWRKMAQTDWNSFGVPRKLTVPESDGQIVEFQKVCLSAHDGILIPHHERGYASRDEMSSGRAKDPKGKDKYMERVNPRILHGKERYNAYSLSGAALFGCCRRLRSHNFTQAHFLMGHGPVFAAASSASKLPRISHVVFHQCPRVDGPPPLSSWPLGEAIDEVIFRWAYDVGMFPREGVNELVVSLPDNSLEWVRQDPSLAETLVCFDQLFMVVPHVPASYLGDESPKIIDQWRQAVGAYLTEGRQPECDIAGPTSAEVGAKLEVEGCPSSCTRGLRMALWQRGNRRISNPGEVEALLGRYSDFPVERLTADSMTPAREQMAMMRCFDVLVSVHGSQLANMVFTPSSRQVVIELQAIPGMDDPRHPFCVNGKTWTRSWILSFGHLPIKPSTGLVDQRLLQDWDKCFARIPEGRGSTDSSYIKDGKPDVEKNGKCNVVPFRKGSGNDRRVDLKHLEEDLHSALRTLCSSGPVAPFRCGMDTVPEERMREQARQRQSRK